MIRVIKESSEILDFSWELNQNKSKGSYPATLFGKKELQDMVDRAITLEYRRVIGYYEDGNLIGVCMYYWLEEEEYAQTEVLLIKENYNLAVDEIMWYMKQHLQGYHFYIGISAENKEAIDYFKERNILCTDASVVNRLFRKNYKMKDINKEITKLEWKDFDEYAKFHDKYATDMYWDSKHLREATNFIIFIYREHDEIKGSIFTKIISNTDAEIFGVFLNEDIKGLGIECDLIGTNIKYIYEEFKEMNEICYFIQEDSKEELDYVLKCGFKVSDRYRLYEGDL